MSDTDFDPLQLSADIDDVAAPNRPLPERPSGVSGVDGDLIRAIEAIVLVATEPVEPGLLAQLLEISLETVVDLCRRLAEAYDDAGHGFRLARVAGGYR